MRRESKRCTIRLKAGDLGADGSFSGYGSVANVVDTGGDLVPARAFAATLVQRKQSGDWPRLLLEHKPECPLGVWDEIREDAHGLFCKGRLSLDVQAGREVYALMKMGHPYGLSIGYETRASSYASAGDLNAKFGVLITPDQSTSLSSGQIRILEEIDLWEVSVVTFPMNVEARVDHVKRAATIVQTKAQPDFSPVFRALARRDAAIRSLT